MTCWERAHDAFEGGSSTAFEWLYDQLRSRWQVFRSRNWDAPSAAGVKKVLDAVPSALRGRRLTELVEDDPNFLVQVWNALTTAASLKTNSDGPSLVAVSKFLHFWNRVCSSSPTARLFGTGRSATGGSGRRSRA